MSDPDVHELLDLPYEVLQNIFGWLDPVDLSPVSRTCRTFAGFIRDNALLWKTVYLNSFVRCAACICAGMRKLTYFRTGHLVMCQRTGSIGRKSCRRSSGYRDY